MKKQKKSLPVLTASYATVIMMTPGMLMPLPVQADSASQIQQQIRQQLSLKIEQRLEQMVAQSEQHRQLQTILRQQLVRQRSQQPPDSTGLYYSRLDCRQRPEVSGS